MIFSIAKDKIDYYVRTKKIWDNDSFNRRIQWYII